MNENSMPARLATESGDAKHARFLTLFLSSEREVFRYICALVPNAADAQDLLQQTALALWNKFDEYDPQSPFVPWACRFALMEVKSFMRRQAKWRALLDGDLVDVLAARRESLEERMNRQFSQLDVCLEKLPSKQRELIGAYYFNREPVERLADSSSRSVDAIYKMLQRVRKLLLDCINANAARGEVGA